MSAKVYDFAAYRLIREEVRREVARRELARRVSWSCTLCSKSGHNRRTCKNPKPGRLAKLGMVSP